MDNKQFLSSFTEDDCLLAMFSRGCGGACRHVDVIGIINTAELAVRRVC